MELEATGIPGVKISQPHKVDGRSRFSEVQAARSASAQRKNRDKYNKNFLEAFTFYQDVINGRRPTWQFEEVMTTSDFPVLFGDILSRELLGNYASLPVSWPSYIRRRTLPDATRQARRLAYDGIDSHMTSANKKPDATSGREDHLEESGYLVGPLDVYERIVSINWKTILADDLGAFRDIPGRLALAARRTEEWLAAQLLADSAGPHATFFTSGHGNTVVTGAGSASDQPALSVQGLTDAMQVWNRMTNPVTGEPIVINGATLVIPRELEVLSNFVFNAVQIEMNKNGGDLTGLSNSSGTETRIIMNNWISNGLTRAVNPYLSTVNSTNGTTAWYIVANPNTNRPAFEMDFLQGEEAPILLRQLPDSVRVGGGSADMFGSFETGEIRYKVMHLLATAQLDYHGAIASQGDGS